MKQFYKIGEISKLYQIGPDSLRYYEELGLLNPTRGENGYRMYGLNDLWRLNVIRDLRKLNFPMEKIASYIRSRSVATTKELLNEELSIIDTHIQTLTQLRENVSERLNTLYEAEIQPIGNVGSDFFHGKVQLSQVADNIQTPEVIEPVHAIPVFPASRI